MSETKKPIPKAWKHRIQIVRLDLTNEIIERREVRVTAIAEGYAMVRRKGCIPYVISLKELEPAEGKKP